MEKGIHNISEQEYHADPCKEPSLSRSIIKTLLFKSPAHAKIAHPRLNPYMTAKNDQKFDIGNAAHKLLLEGDDNCEIIDADNWRTKAAKEQRELAWANGKIPLLVHEYEATSDMVEAGLKQIHACPDLGIANLRKEGNAELSVIWDETDAIDQQSWHRVRPDWWSSDRKIMIDYKTTGTSADPNEYLRHIFTMGYDIQEAYYRRGAKAVTGIDPKFIFVVQETEEPYLCSFIGLSPQYQEMGKQKVEFGISLWNQCMTSGVWTGYPEKICYVEPPAWAVSAWEQRSCDIGV